MSQDIALAEGPEGRPIEVPASYLEDLPQFFKPYEGDAGKHAAPSTRRESITEGPTVEELARAATLGEELPAPTQTEDEAPAESEDEPPVRPETER
ncbi:MULTISPECIES: hypothetical protein [unclassified Pseudoclavibacter]|uniref:hypothetical protein n=1 Tax=unclassified Pseudoclavibacter TaxID=2615177 RepID=UPI000CE836E3|nr:MULTISPECIES: hypothetical protein [unclassified Pseudoclavibacter]MBF4549236.1 hypothetical protein [Pseudoclavibacter sp. VKM Ac-2888]PPF38340.1 hypothetical protein C5E05_04830 [Pseudoclavibacter sp. AY1H1]